MTMVSVHSVSAEGLIHSIEFTPMQFGKRDMPNVTNALLVLKKADQFVFDCNRDAGPSLLA